MSRVALAIVLAALVTACVDERDPSIENIDSNDCVACHSRAFAMATQPVHEGAFPQSCFECHSTSAWAPSTFAHERAVSECVACHIRDFEATANPVHPGSFPQTCDDCHSTVAWQPALEGEHPEAAFATRSGPHEKFGCTECHNPARGSSVAGENTDCIGCHTGEHSAARSNEQHSGVADYAFDSGTPNFCLMCHPNGRK